jgi:hypothetical protein
VQAIKYDEREVKVAKWSWDDRELSPIELVDEIWNEIPDFRESYEMPDGMLRTKLPAYDELVVRELLVNALVHRPYTQRGDIYLNLHPDRLEVVNPGRLPIGVTPKNILHASRRRNDGLARIFHDMKLMEREGSGIDLLFERLLTSGRKAPTIVEGTDSVHVTVPRRVVQPGIIKLLVEADQRYQLTQRERITLAFIAQTEPSPRPNSPSSWSCRTQERCDHGSGGSLRWVWSNSRAARTRRATSCRPRSCAKPGSTGSRHSPACSHTACGRSSSKTSSASRTRRRATSIAGLDQRSPNAPSGARSKTSSHLVEWLRPARREPVGSASSQAFLATKAATANRRHGPGS